MTSITAPPAVIAGASRLASQRVVLWLLMAVICVLFGLITLAYLIRARMGDWQPMPLPWQVLLSTLVLLFASLCWHRAARPGVENDNQRLPALRLAGWLSLGFILIQGWGWWQLTNAGYLVAGNPANSFFYLFTGLHALHLAGGLLAWRWALAAVSGPHDRAPLAQLALCARYWHFLLALWLVILVLLLVILPEVPPWAAPGDAALFCRYIPLAGAIA